MILKEIIQYVISQRKWWLAPIVFLLFLVALFVFFADSAVAPFIYSLILVMKRLKHFFYTVNKVMVTLLMLIPYVVLGIYRLFLTGKNQ